MKRILLISLCLSLCLSMSGCKKEQIVAARKENSGGSGYGVTQKSILTVDDLYFFSVNTTKSQVLAALGSPQKYTIAADGAVTYLLDTGATLELTYNERDMIRRAVYTDESGKEQGLFSFLASLQEGTSAQNQNTGIGNQVSQAEKENEKEESQKPSTNNGASNNQKPSTNNGATNNQKPATNNGGTNNQKPATNNGATTGQKPATGNGSGIGAELGNYFSSERYSIDVASKLLAVGAQRQKILSALGKPNGYSSISFEQNSHLIDVYYMSDGSVYYLDYGYGRSNLRAVRVVKGARVSVLLGVWGQEEMPADFSRTARNLTLFNSLKRGAKPSEIYRRFGEPDWYEGNASAYKDAYQLVGGAVLYLDFGSGHSSLTSATVRQKTGAIVPFTLR